MRNLIFGIKNGNVVHISDVESGKKCGCICPECGDMLVAKKGNIIMHHFAHYNYFKCKRGYETSLYLAAEKIINEEKKFFVPKASIETLNCYKTLTYGKGMLLNTSKVELVKDEKNNIRYMIVYINEKALVVYIRVYEMISSELLNEFKNKSISVLEIDMSMQDEYFSKEYFKNILLDNCSNKKWVFNAKIKCKLDYIMTKAERKSIILKYGKNVINNCPKSNTQVLYDKDCNECKYNFGKEKKILYCTGKVGYSDINDIK